MSNDISLLQKANILSVVSFSLFILISCGERNEDEIFEMIEPVALIPMPQELGYTTNSFILNPDTKIFAPDSLENEAIFLSNLIEVEFGYPLELVNTEPADKFIELSVGNISFDSYSGEEGYELNITPSQFKASGNSRVGLFWSIQSLAQIFSQTDHQDGYAVRVQGMYLKDFPRFRHRGLLLDCCRHFFDKEVVKHYIDLLSYYKMNVLHWHLTEDQGWRIEIDRYPLLTEHGAWRTEQDGSRYGGFYSKNDIREIVAYAEERNVTVIPEIELPGHSQAAISAYPHLSCEQQPVPVANDWGVFKEIYCAGNDSTFVFLENVLSEVMDLFPSRYIHIGGDEAPKFRWEHCSKCQHRIKTEQLADEHELQSYFIKRVEKFLNDNGRQLIGWDEILEGGLSENATIQSWRGMDGGIRAAESGHYAIMSPTSHCYLDYGLDAIDLEKVYSFNPIPDSLGTESKKYILGGEVNMWTERVPDKQNLAEKILPRMLALSEVLWTGSENGDFENFQERLDKHYDRMDTTGIVYGAETIPVRLDIESDTARLIPAVRNVKIEYALAREVDSKPEFVAYEVPVFINRDITLFARAVKNGVTYGSPISQTFTNTLKTKGEPNYIYPFSDWYTGGGTKALVNGRLGSSNFRDGNWQGFWGTDMQVEFELITPSNITEVSANFLQYNNSWIFMPTKLIVEVSADGKKWFKSNGVMPKTRPKDRGRKIENLRCKVDDKLLTRYIRLTAQNIGEVPSWHEAAGSKAWIFIDEIMLK